MGCATASSAAPTLPQSVQDGTLAKRATKAVDDIRTRKWEVPIHVDVDFIKPVYEVIASSPARPLFTPSLSPPVPAAPLPFPPPPKPPPSPVGQVHRAKVLGGGARRIQAVCAAGGVLPARGDGDVGHRRGQGEAGEDEEAAAAEAEPDPHQGEGRPRGAQFEPREDGQGAVR